MATGEWATPDVDGAPARWIDARVDAGVGVDRHDAPESRSDVRTGRATGADPDRDRSVPGDVPARVIAALAAYPPIAACLLCREYAFDHDTDADRWSLLAATLAYHDMSHRDDPLDLGREHFGPLG